MFPSGPGASSYWLLKPVGSSVTPPVGVTLSIPQTSSKQVWPTHMLPSGPRASPVAGPIPDDSGYSVITPAGVILATTSSEPYVNQTLPSAPAAMKIGWTEPDGTGYSVIVPNVAAPAWARSTMVIATAPTRTTAARPRRARTFPHLVVI